LRFNIVSCTQIRDSTFRRLGYHKILRTFIVLMN